METIEVFRYAWDGLGVVSWLCLVFRQLFKDKRG